MQPLKSVAASTKHYTKAQKINRAMSEKAHKAPRDITPPAWLAPGAVEEFNRVVKLAAEADMLDGMDTAYLAMYADAYEQYRQAALYIKAHGLITEKGGVSHMVALQEKAARRMLSCSTKLGLSTTDRLKLSVPVSKVPEKKKENKFLQFLDA